jgi:hypothetical protein
MVGLAGLVVLGVAAGAFAWAQRDRGYPEEWDSRVVELVEFVELERGLDFDHPVEVNFLTPEEYGNATRISEGELTDADRQALDEQASMLRALGMANGDLDLFEAGNDMADTGTLAFYDPGTEEIVVRGTEIDVTLEATLVHELTHALQDQHFDLDAATRDLDPNDSDDTARYHAYTALVEGDAMRIELGYVDRLSSDELDEYTSTYEEGLAEAEWGSTRLRRTSRRSRGC